jgi:hypothetical protein
MAWNDYRHTCPEKPEVSRAGERERARANGAQQRAVSQSLRPSPAGAPLSMGVSAIPDLSHRFR